MAKSRHLPKKDNGAKKEKEFRKRALQFIQTRETLNMVLVLALLVLISGGAGIIYLNSVDIQVNENTPAIIANLVNLNNNLFRGKESQMEKKPAAVVNGEEISMEELDERYALLPPQYSSFITKEEILRQIIDEKLMLQAAQNKGLDVSEEEIGSQVETLLEQNQMTIEQLEESLRSRNLTLEMMEEFTRKELLLAKLLNETVTARIMVSDTDIQDYYFTNLEQFTIPESVNVSHILICHDQSERCLSNLTKEEALEEAKTVRGMLNDTNFAEIAMEYSDEPAAELSGGNLQWVSVQDPFDQTFLNKTFELEAGEVSEPVETVFGYHLIKVFEKREPATLDLESVYGQINQTLSIELQQGLFLEYLSSLRNESEIINYLEPGNEE